jgi:hypothetical protein
LKDHLKTRAYTTQGGSLKVREIQSIESNRTFGDGLELDYCTAGRGFAGTGLPDKSECLPAGQREADAIDGSKPRS